MTSDTTWHADPEVLAGYVAGTLGRARTASVETHLVVCPMCRAGLAPLVAPDRLERNLVAITDRVDRPQVHPVERLLGRLGVPEHVLRLLAVTASARAAWLTGVVVALAVAGIVTDVEGADERTVFVLLVAAPLLPLAGLAATFGSRADPARELVVTTPTPAFDLVLVRALAVLAPTIVVAAGAAAFAPGRDWEPVLWLLPSFGLATATLALGTWFDVRAVAWVLGGGWVAAAAVSVRDAPMTDLVQRYPAFRPGGQLVLVAVTVTAAAIAARRRDAFDRVDLGGTS